MQAERTRLAWARTALALAVVGGLELRIGHVDAGLLQRIPGLLTLTLAVGCWVYGARRYTAIVQRLQHSERVLDSRHGITLAVLALLPAAIGVWAILG